MVPTFSAPRRLALLGLLLTSLAGPAFAQAVKARPYALAAAPLEIFDRLPSLELGPTPPLAAAERQLLAKAWAARAKDPAKPVPAEDDSLLEALLFASGVADEEAQRKYRAQFDALLAGARAATKDAKDNRERGEALMKFLHGGVMKKGYEANQTSLATVFDAGKYNCVSSTALYYLLGTRLGLKLRAISIAGSQYQSGHAALDLVEGAQRVQIEPTNPDGFDWQTKVKRPGVVVLGYVPDRSKGREVDGLGLAAAIYSNRGVAHCGEKQTRRLEAASCYLAALALDPADEAATNNLLSVFVNWGLELTKEKKFEEAVRVLAFGLAFDPKSGALRNNQRVAWADYIMATLQAGKDQEGVALLGRAAKAAPDDKDFQKPGLWFSRLGEERLRKEDWEGGLACVERGLKVAPASERPGLLAWRISLFRRWSQALLSKADADGSLKALARAYSMEPANREVAAGIAYHTQAALPLLEKKAGTPAVFQHYAALREQFPKVDAVTEAATAYAMRQVEKLAADQKNKEAVEAAAQLRPLLATPEQQARVGALAYDKWARRLADRKDWNAALEKYAEGLKAFPKNSLLAGNAHATADQWSQPARAAKNWAEAIRIYDVGLAHFPGDKYLLQKKQQCEQMKEKGP